MKNPLETAVKLGVRAATIGSVLTIGMGADQLRSSILCNVLNPRPAYAEGLSLTPTERATILKAVPFEQYARFEHAASLVAPYGVQLVLIPVDFETPKPVWGPDQKKQYEDILFHSYLLPRGLIKEGKLDLNTILVAISTKPGQQIDFRYGEGLKRLFDQSLPWEKGKIYPSVVGLREGLYAGNTKRLGNDTVGEFAERIHVHAMAYADLLPQRPRLQDQNIEEEIFGKTQVPQTTSAKAESTKEYELEIEFLTEPEINPHEEELEHLGYRSFTFKTSRIPQGEPEERSDEWIKWSAHLKAELILSGAMAVDEEGNTRIPEGTIVLVVDKEGKRIVTIDDGVATDLDEIFKKYSGIIISVDDYFTRSLQNRGDTTEKIAQLWGEIKGNLILHKQEPKAQTAQAETVAPEAPRQEEPVVLPQPIQQSVQEVPPTPQQKSVKQPSTQIMQKKDLPTEDITIWETLWNNMPDASKIAIIMGFALIGGAITFSKRSEAKNQRSAPVPFDIPLGPTPSKIVRLLKRIKEQGQSMEDWIKVRQITHPEEWEAAKATLAEKGIFNGVKHGGTAALFRMQETLGKRRKQVEAMGRMIQEQGAALPQFLLPKAQPVPAAVPVAAFDAGVAFTTQEPILSSGSQEFFPEPVRSDEEKPIRRVRRVKRGVSAPEIITGEDVNPTTLTTTEETVGIKDPPAGGPEMSAEDVRGLKIQLEKIMRATHARIRRFGLDPSRYVENTREKTTAWASDVKNILDAGKDARRLFKKGDFPGVQKAIKEMQAVHNVLNEESKAYQSRKSMDTLVELDMEQHTWKYAVKISQKEDYLKTQGVVFEANGHATNGMLHVEDTSAITRTAVPKEEKDKIFGRMVNLSNHTATTSLKELGELKDQLLEGAFSQAVRITYQDELHGVKSTIKDAETIERAMRQVEAYQAMEPNLSNNLPNIKDVATLNAILTKVADTVDAVKKTLPFYQFLAESKVSNSTLRNQVRVLENASEAAVKEAYKMVVEKGVSTDQKKHLIMILQRLIGQMIALDKALRPAPVTPRAKVVFPGATRLPARNGANGKMNGHVNGTVEDAKKEELISA